MKVLKYFGIFLVTLLIVYLLGPKMKFDLVESSIPTVDLELNEIDNFLNKKLSKIQGLKEGNKHELVFHDGLKKTEYVLLYLHGFSASPKEGFPLHQEIAERYGMNFFAPLLAGHGRKTKESFVKLQPSDLINDAKEAVAIAKLLGEKIIVMSCSTGSTLSVFLDAENPGLFEGQLMFSPNIDLLDQKSKLLTKPWGLPLAQAITGSDYHSFKMPKESKPYWTTEYRIEGLVAVRTLLNQTMTKSVWKKIKTPLLIGYYYEDEDHMDDVISIEAIKEFEKSVATSDNEKWVIPFSEPKNHVIICGIQPTNDISQVRNKSFEFMEQVLKMVPAKQVELTLIPAE